jgi:glycosyltransferase involved in cell wall biosynthesis
MEHSLTLIIPAYQEEESIGSVLDEIATALKSTGKEYPIIVVDDGSTDKTAAIAEAKGARVIRHEENRGYGASLKTGIREAETDYICIIDADGTYDASVLPDMIKQMGTYDMIVGARDWVPPSRAFAKWVLRKIANFLAETKIPDLNSGLRVIRKSLVEKFWTLLPNGFSFTTTITLASLCNGYNVKYMPVHYRQRGGKSKIQPIRNTWQFFMLIIRVIVYFNPLRVFLPVGMGFILLGILIGLYSKLVLGKLMDVTTITAVTSGVEIVMIGLLADLIAKRGR